MRDEIRHSPSAIQQRASYARFKHTAEFLAHSPTIEEILCHIHGLIDACSGYGDQTAANYARESLALLTQEDQSLQTRMEKAPYRTFDEGGKIASSNIIVYQIQENDILEVAQERGVKLDTEQMDAICRRVNKGYDPLGNWCLTIEMAMDDLGMEDLSVEAAIPV